MTERRLWPNLRKSARSGRRQPQGRRRQTGDPLARAVKPSRSVVVAFTATRPMSRPAISATRAHRLAIVMPSVATEAPTTRSPSAYARAWASAARQERIRPPEPRKPREVTIGRTERGAMFQGDSGKDGVHDERAGGLAVADKATQNVPVALARLDNAGYRQSEPGGDRRLGLGSGKRTLEYARVRSDPQKGPERQPGEADELRPAERRLEPGPTLLMLLRSRVIGVKQQVRVDEDHR